MDHRELCQAIAREELAQGGENGRTNAAPSFPDADRDGPLQYQEQLRLRRWRFSDDH